MPARPEDRAPEHARVASPTPHALPTRSALDARNVLMGAMDALCGIVHRPAGAPPGTSAVYSAATLGAALGLTEM